MNIKQLLMAMFGGLMIVLAGALVGAAVLFVLWVTSPDAAASQQPQFRLDCKGAQA